MRKSRNAISIKHGKVSARHYSHVSTRWETALNTSSGQVSRETHQSLLFLACCLLLLLLLFRPLGTATTTAAAAAAAGLLLCLDKKMFVARAKGLSAHTHSASNDNNVRAHTRTFTHPRKTAGRDAHPRAHLAPTNQCVGIVLHHSCSHSLCEVPSLFELGRQRPPAHTTHTDIPSTSDWRGETRRRDTTQSTAHANDR